MVFDGLWIVPEWQDSAPKASHRVGGGKGILRLIDVAADVP